MNVTVRGQKYDFNTVYSQDKESFGPQNSIGNVIRMPKEGYNSESVVSNKFEHPLMIEDRQIKKCLYIKSEFRPCIYDRTSYIKLYM